MIMPQQGKQRIPHRSKAHADTPKHNRSERQTESGKLLNQQQLHLGAAKKRLNPK